MSRASLICFSSRGTSDFSNGSQYSTSARFTLAKSSSLSVTATPTAYHLQGR